MAIDLVVEVEIARPVEEVFAELVAVERWPDWLIASGIVRVDVADGRAGVASGSGLRIEQRVAGRASTLDAKVTVFEPGTRFAVAGKDGDGITVGIEAHALPTPTGTRLRWHVRIGLPLRYRLFESMAAPQVERAARLDLEAFRLRLEAPQAG